MGKLLVRFLVSIAIAGVAVYWLTGQGFDVLPSLGAIQSAAAWWAIPVYVVLFSLFHMLRAWRWIYLLRPFARVSTRAMMESAYAGFAAIQMMPLRTGEIIRPYLLDRYAGVSKSALFGTIAIERVVDGLLVSLWLTAALFAAPRSNVTYLWGVLPLLIFSVALVLLIAFYLWPENMRKLLIYFLGFVSSKLADFVVGVLERFHVGLTALKGKGSLWSFVAVSIFYWGINAVAFYLLAMGCGLPLPMVGAVAGMGCLAVGILLPAGPGYFGNFQVAVLAALEMYLSPEIASGQSAVVFIFLLYVLQTGLTVLFGAGGLLFLRRRKVVSRPEE
ncbi:MAG: flippase-like domain-containing protein [Desulfobacterales bacterium]|nr:flippase-like domain-containing protein [Desulfobacterales bacterium]